MDTKQPDADPDAEFERLFGPEPEPLERGEHESYLDSVRASMAKSLDHAFDPESEMRRRADERTAAASASVERPLDPALECPQCGRRKKPEYSVCYRCYIEDLVLCVECEERYHRPEFDQCYPCMEAGL